MTDTLIERLIADADRWMRGDIGRDNEEAGVLSSEAAQAIADLTAENERLREALKATPLRAKNESGRDFDDRQTAWLRDFYNPALKGKS